MTPAEQIEQALNVLHGPAGIVEVRILGAPRAGTVSGYYDADHFGQLSGLTRGRFTAL